MRSARQQPSDIPPSFILDSCSLKLLSQSKGRDKERLRDMVLDGKLIHILGISLLSELYGMVKLFKKYPDAVDRFKNQLDELMYLKTMAADGSRPYVFMMKNFFWNRIDLELKKGGRLSLNELARDAIIYTHTAYTAPHSEAALAEIQKRSDYFREMKKETDKRVKSVTKLARFNFKEVPGPHELVETVADIAKRSYGVDKPKSYPTILSTVSMAVYLSWLQVKDGKARPYNYADTTFFVDAAYADILVTDDKKEREKNGVKVMDDDGLYPRVKQLQELGLVDRPQWVFTFDEFMDWFSSWKPGDPIRRVIYPPPRSPSE